MNEKEKTAEIVERFIKTVYPEMTELVMSVNTEATCLQDAIELINDLRTALARWKAQAESLQKEIDRRNDQTLSDSDFGR